MNEKKVIILNIRTHPSKSAYLCDSHTRHRKQSYHCNMYIHKLYSKFCGVSCFIVLRQESGLVDQISSTAQWKQLRHPH